MRKNKRLWEIHVRSVRTGKSPGEYLWIIAPDSQTAISKAERVARKNYGERHRVYKVDQHGTVDAL